MYYSLYNHINWLASGLDTAIAFIAQFFDIVDPVPARINFLAETVQDQ